MSKSNLGKRVESLSRLVMWMILAVVLLGVTMLVERGGDTKLGERLDWLEKQTPSQWVQGTEDGPTPINRFGEIDIKAAAPKTAKECLALMEQGYTQEEVQEMLGPDDKWILPVKHTKEEVTDALAIASLKDYAGLEAERMAKMANALMGMGGKFTAHCSVAYKGEEKGSIIEYSLAWQKGVWDDKEKPIMLRWEGASWGECIQKMLAWKQGGE